MQQKISTSNNEKVNNIVNTIFGRNMHSKRTTSLSNAAIGLLNSEKLLLHKIGDGLSLAKTLNKKHATKQIDRFLSNKKFDIWEQGCVWVPYIRCLVFSKQLHRIKCWNYCVILRKALANRTIF